MRCLICKKQKRNNKMKMCSNCGSITLREAVKKGIIKI